MHTSVWQLDLLVRKEDWFVLIFLSSVVMVQSINTCRSHGGPNTTTYVRFVITGLSTWTRYAYMARLALAACLHLLRSCHNAVRAALRVACQGGMSGTIGGTRSLLVLSFSFLSLDFFCCLSGVSRSVALSTLQPSLGASRPLVRCA